MKRQAKIRLDYEGLANALNISDGVAIDQVIATPYDESVIIVVEGEGDWGGSPAGTDLDDMAEISLTDARPLPWDGKPKVSDDQARRLGRVLGELIADPGKMQSSIDDIAEVFGFVL